MVQCLHIDGRDVERGRILNMARSKKTAFIIILIGVCLPTATLPFVTEFKPVPELCLTSNFFQNMGNMIVVLGGNGRDCAVVPGNEKLNVKKFKAAFGIKDLRFASPEEVIEITSLEIGAIPPVGKAMNLKSYYDKSFLGKELVAFNAGYHTKSIKMKSEDLIKVEGPIIEDII